MKDRVPRGTTVAGVNIGGMSKPQAEKILQEQLPTSAPITVTAGNLTAEFNPAASGLSLDLPATIERAGTPRLNPVARISSFFNTHEVGVVSVVNTATFNPAVTQLAQQLTAAPTNAALDLATGPAQPVDGQHVDQDELADKLQRGWLAPVTIDAIVDPPAIGADALAAAQAIADKATSSDVIAKGRDAQGVITPDRMQEILHFIPEGGQLRAELDAERARDILMEGLAPSERPLKNATFKLVSGKPTVIPSSDGVKIEWNLEDLPNHIIGDAPREFDVTYTDKPATYTTEMAEKATFNNTVGEFTTGGFSSASGVNIRRVAQMVDGAVVAPGETFSLNGYTGPRGTAQGFVESGIILNGRADKAVGGGISQFATTLYNAAYFAGMDDVAHTPHSYYISRYPAGREATVYEGAIDLQFKNTTLNPVIIRASANDSTVTVSLIGTKSVNVQSIPGAWTNPTQPNTVEVHGPDCSPSSGVPGFTTTDTRVVTGLDGREISRTTTTTKYDPAPIVKCVN
ncbi:VanW family protein [Corynebacterium argentoratense]|uniref:VanW family protein n=1 Tax=Corynebacterium argentoratense TaxID=42817 RepID=UPI003C6FF523